MLTMSHRICNCQQVMFYIHECGNNVTLNTLIPKAVKLTKFLAELYYSYCNFFTNYFLQANIFLKIKNNCWIIIYINSIDQITVFVCLKNGLSNIYYYL